MTYLFSILLAKNCQEDDNQTRMLMDDRTITELDRRGGSDLSRGY